MPDHAATVLAPEGLAQFRETWTGPELLRLLGENGGRLLVSWPVGVGKSHALDDVTATAVETGAYDLVVVLAPTRDVLEERRWLKNPPVGLKVINLRPRPENACGSASNAQWRTFEQQGLGLLGRKLICGPCARCSECYWPRQYGSSLNGARVIFGTQAHLERDPFFVARLTRWVGSRRPLVLVDEANFLAANLRRSLRPNDLVRFDKVLAGLEVSKAIDQWREVISHLLLVRDSVDLRADGWRLPDLNLKQAAVVQERGRTLLGGGFRNIAPELVALGLSSRDSREKLADGSVAFSVQPAIGADLVVFSGTIAPEFASFRLGAQLPAPFQDRRFAHPRTRWYNLASRLGMLKYWPAHADQTLDFFAALSAKRISEGKRVLLIAKKTLVPRCQAGMQSRLKQLIGEVEVAVAPLDQVDLRNPRVIPLINFGVVGVNLFEDFDCAFCLSGYYVNEPALNSLLGDLGSTDQEVPLEIGTSDWPPRRWVKPRSPRQAFTDVAILAPAALRHLEGDVVLQAVGRVRPFTKPREIITFQCAPHPYGSYEAEFVNLEEARSYFGVESRLRSNKQANLLAVRQARQEGLSQRQAADRTGLGLRTIKRYWSA